VFDPFSQSLAAVSSRSVSAASLVFLAGAASSLGPCVAPRLVAAAGLASGRRNAAALVLAFVAGLMAAYAAFGAVTSLLGRAAHWSAYTYGIVALALAGGGAVTLWRGDRACGRHRDTDRATSMGGAMLLGASFALVVSPCCTPLVAGIVAYTSASGSAAYGSLLLVSFALGHALPIIPVAFGVNRAARLLQRHAVRQAASVVSATLMLALSAYYAVLA
jgi:cytochrome c biogenesis protein CcdA